MLTASCPSCGAPISFANKGSLATVCGSCRSVSVRQGQDLSVYGTVGEIQDDASVIQLGVTGQYDSNTFTVLGRLQITYKGGFWNEWHIGFGDGTFGWLAEAQGHFSIQRPVAADPPNLPHKAYRPTETVDVCGEPFIVSGIGEASVLAGEGSLPFPVNSGGYKLPFVDLVNHGRGCVTLDYSDDPTSSSPRLFMGHWVDATTLSLQNLRSPGSEAQASASLPTTAAQSLNCPNCGGGLEFVTGRQAASVHCQFCGSAIDTSSEPFSVYQVEASRNLPIGNLLKLGDKGTFDGHEFTVIAIMEREATKWSFTFVEYLLYHPLAGYRWLVEADGHYTWMRSLPYEPHAERGRHSCLVENEWLGLIDSGPVVVRRVVGELYWRVRVGDRVKAHDYAAAPYAATLEWSKDEHTWSFGEYVEGHIIANAFGRPRPRKPRTVAPNQPNPYSDDLRHTSVRWVAAVIAILLIAFVLHIVSDNTVVGAKSVRLELPTVEAMKNLRSTKNAAGLAWRDKNTLFLGPLDIPSGPTSLELELDVKQPKWTFAWLSFTCSLYDPQRSESRDFVTDALDLSAYDDELRSTKTLLPRVKTGSYYVRLEPYLHPGSINDYQRWYRDMSKNNEVLQYKVTIRRDVPVHYWLVASFVFVTLPLIWFFLKRQGFERQRMEDN